MRNQQPKEFLLNLFENFVPEMRYDGKGSIVEWQKAAREKLADILGLRYMVKCDYDFKIEETKEYDGFTQHRFTFQSEPGYYAVCYIRIPHGAEKIAPMICIQGHSKGQHISLGEPKFPGDEATIAGGDRDFCKYALENGFAAVTIEQRYMGENGGDKNGPGCYFFKEGVMPCHQTLLYGRCAIGERVWDTMNLINVLAENFGVLDMDNVACMGNSGGGTATAYVGAMDERIKVVMPSCAVCTYRDSIVELNHCTCNYVPGVARYFDMAELCGMIAPRKLIIVAGKEDPIFPKKGVEETFSIAKNTYYKAFDKEDNVAVVFGDEGHRFYAKPAYEQYNKMK
ncbi:MAG: acetylxylan esterase [Clostridia bacterium]|nr:acetylxylan esterase [Clostridia bacterium]